MPSPFESGSYYGQDGTIWNNPQSQNYQVQSASETAMNDNWFTRLLDPTGLVSGFWNDLTGVTSQSREFAQQEYLQDKENEYNLPVNQMARLKAAGINPLTSAAGVAGTGNQSAQAPQVASNTNGVASGIGAAAQAVGAFTGGAASLAEAAFKRSTLNPTVENLQADTSKKLAELGLTNEEIYSWQVDNKYKEENAQIDLRLKGLKEEDYMRQWQLLDSQRELMLAQLNQSVEEAKLAAARIGEVTANKDYLAALKAKTDYEAKMEQERYEFWLQRGFDIRTSSTDAILVQKLENGHSIQDIVHEMSSYYGSLKDSELRAIGDNAYRNAYNEAAGKAFVEWSSRPNTVPAMLTDLGRRLGNALRNNQASRDEAISQLTNDSNFNRAYDDFKRSQKSEVDRLRKEYKKAKRYLNSEEAALAFRKYQNALTVYDEFDKDDFANMLLNQY